MKEEIGRAVARRAMAEKRPVRVTTNLRTMEGHIVEMGTHVNHPHTWAHLEGRTIAPWMHRHAGGGSFLVDVPDCQIEIL